MLLSRFPDFGVIWLMAHAFPSPIQSSMLRPSGRSHPRAFGAKGADIQPQHANTNTQTPCQTYAHISNRSETHRQTNGPISCWPTVPSSTAVIAMHDRSTIAAIAQVGERQTEDLKVPVSIPGLGTCLPPSFSCPVCFFVFLSV